MDSRATRETLISTGLHIGATHRLGDSYSNAEYMEAVDAARKAGDGERYADRVLGVDVGSLLHGVEDDGEAVIRAAESRLRDRGIDPRKATYREYADALVGVSS
jgi:hypothetical protein